MTTTKNSGTSTSNRTKKPDPVLRSPARPVRAGDSLAAMMMGAHPDMMSRFCEKFLPADTEATPEESREFRAMEQFLGRHVKPAGIRDVQCMLLWNEWVRTFTRESFGFPRIFREKAFNEAVTDTFGIAITRNGSQGDVFRGIKFIP